MLNIRVATPDDLTTVHPLIERAYRGDAARAGWSHEADLLEGERIDPAALAAIVDDPASRLLIAEEGGAMIGCIHVADHGGNTAYIGLLAVEPELQAAGTGKRLLEAAERVAREVFDAKRAEMTVIDRRAELIAYYRRRGYLPSGETRDFPVMLDPPFHMAVLVKPLL